MNFIIPAILDIVKPDLYRILLESVKSIARFEPGSRIFIFLNNSHLEGDWIKSLLNIKGVSTFNWNEPIEGFGRICNLAIEYSSFNEFVLMNSDVFLLEPISKKIEKAVKDNPKFGAIFPHWLPYSENDNEYEKGFGVGSGSFFYTTYDIMRSVKFFSTEYKIGFFEDRDLWLKMLSKGYELVRIRKSMIKHLGNSTVKYFLTPEIIERNKEVFKKKWSKTFPNIVATF